jgi:hypothetical protein
MCAKRRGEAAGGGGEGSWPHILESLYISKRFDDLPAVREDQDNFLIPLSCNALSNSSLKASEICFCYD